MAQITLAIDAMGGDSAPEMVIEGLSLSTVRHPDVRFLVFGCAEKVPSLLEAYPVLKERCHFVATETVIAMDEKPAQAVRKGRESSLWKAVQSVAEGQSTAVVSAGNTGALMAIAKLVVKTVAGINRPAIASTWPTFEAQTIVLDLGANIDADAQQLFEFAVMGAEFARILFEADRPRVGLLNIGVEAPKGNETVKEAAQKLQMIHGERFVFHGYVEGNDIAKGIVDVVVTDGFTGNVALKTAEGTAKLIGHYLKNALTYSWFSRLGCLFAAGGLKVFKQKIDPRRVNGGVFLGLNGLVVKSHGGTDALGFATAVDLAIDLAKANVTEAIKTQVIQALQVCQEKDILENGQS